MLKQPFKPAFSGLWIWHSVCSFDECTPCGLASENRSYHGILAPNAHERSQVVPAPPSPTVSLAGTHPPSPLRPHRLPWAALLARVFALDVTVCPDCGGRLCLIAALTDPVSVWRYLQGVGLPTESPPLLPARAPPQQAWDFAA